MSDTLETFRKKLNELINEIASVKKNITYYDVYNITDAVYDKNNFDAQVNALVNNSSLVVNTAGPFSSNEEIYYPGDVVLKNAAGDLIHINAQTSGTYYPKQIIGSDGSYTISYGYTKETPSLSSSTVPIGSEEEAKPAQTIVFNGLAAADPEKSAIYGIYDSMSGSTYSFNAAGNIRPLIKFFLIKDTDMEEISLEYTLTLNSNQYTIEIPSAIENLYIEVK